MQWFLGDWLHCSSLWCSESKLHLSPVPLFDSETWVVCCFVQELQQLKETIAVKTRPVCLAGSPFLSLISRHSTLKASLFHVPLSSKLSFFFFFCRCCCLCPSRPRYAPSVTIEEDNCCGCNAIAIRRHFLDENMTSVDIVYTSCHDAVRSLLPPSYLGRAPTVPPNGAHMLPDVVVQKKGTWTFSCLSAKKLCPLDRNICLLPKSDRSEECSPVRDGLSSCSFFLSRRICKQECFTWVLQQWIFSRFMKLLSMWLWTMIRRR